MRDCSSPPRSAASISCTYRSAVQGRISVSSPKTSSWSRSDTERATLLARLGQREHALRLERHCLHAARHHDLAVDLVVDLVARAGLREELRERRQRVAGHVDEHGRAIERLDLHLARRSAREQTLTDDAQREANFADEQGLGVLIVNEQPDSIALRRCRYRGQRGERGDGDVRRRGLTLRGGGPERDDEKATK